MNGLEKEFSTGSDSAPQGTFSKVQKHFFGCHIWEDAPGIYRVDTTKHPTVHRTPSHCTSPAPRNDGAEVRNSGLNYTFWENTPAALKEQLNFIDYQVFWKHLFAHKKLQNTWS